MYSTDDKKVRRDPKGRHQITISFKAAGEDACSTRAY